ncbi:MAG TPA: hypothetical protein VFX97_20760 [Pyrinomonadaceae bacterium]|nr:hypothetical protein [Pyrinomonadaceae bacterium]
MNETEKPRHSTAPVPSGVCGKCRKVRPLDRETKTVLPHKGCNGAGIPVRRVLAQDQRRRGELVLAPDSLEVVSRAEAARICGVDPRTIGRWAALGYITKYEDARGRVAFSLVQIKAMNVYEPVE